MWAEAPFSSNEGLAAESGPATALHPWHQNMISPVPTVPTMVTSTGLVDFEVVSSNVIATRVVTAHWPSLLTV